METKKLVEIGWREWVSLPDLHIDEIKAKVDTGAKTSALHAFDIRLIEEDGNKYVRFRVHPYQRDEGKTVTAKVKLLERRYVTNSGGKKELRPVILTSLEIHGEKREIELTLTNRGTMGFRMLLGREALRHHFVINPGRSFLLKKRKRTKKRKMKKR